jgi:hypothetical protein
MFLKTKMSILKPGSHNFGQTNTGKSKGGSTRDGNDVGPLKRGSTAPKGKGVGGSKGQAGGGTTKRSGGQISGGKNGGF